MPETSHKSSMLARLICSNEPKYLNNIFFLVLPIPLKLSKEELIEDLDLLFFNEEIAYLWVPYAALEK